MLSFKFWKNQPASVIILQIVTFCVLLVAEAFCIACIVVFGQQYYHNRSIAKGLILVDQDICFIFSAKFPPQGDYRLCEFVLICNCIVALTILLLLAVIAALLFIRSVCHSDPPSNILYNILHSIDYQGLLASSSLSWLLAHG